MSDAYDHDYLSAAFHLAAQPSDDSSMDALDVYRPAQRGHETAGDEESVETVLFTAHNPERTVTAVALMSGRILRVELSHKVVHMTESELSVEISLVCEIARMQALAAQHAILARLLRVLGRDPAETASVLWRQLGLPAPEMLSVRRTEVFTGRSTTGVI